MTIYCATTNPGKLREFQEASGDVRIEALQPGISAPEETGSTFEENARLKAIYYSSFADGPLFADDSGLEVDALKGAPGVHSARYAGPNASDEDNNHLLLQNMADIQDRTGRFVCVIALALRGKVLATFRGSVEGQILTEPRGTGGFGYDPLFFYPPYARSFGEAPLGDKMLVSHRAQALEKLLEFVRNQNSATQ